MEGNGAMNEKQSGGRVSIGTSSLILIFIILSLTVFGLLSLSSAGSDWKLAQKNAEAVKGYYEADSLAVEFAAMVEEVLSRYSRQTDDEEYLRLVKEELGSFFSGGNQYCPDRHRDALWTDASCGIGDRSGRRGRVSDSLLECIPLCGL